VTPEALEEQARQLAAIEEEFTGWEAWVSLDGWWHARIKGATPPVMVHAESPEELAEQIRFRAGATP
jgi:hypothetical protein